VGLVARLEVDDRAQAPLPGAQAAEHLAAREPADHQQLVGLGDVEPLAVHLLLGELDGLADAVQHGVARPQVPEPLVGAILAPLERAGGAHQPLERLGEVARVKDDQAHPAQHRALHPVDDGVAHLGMRLVTPPDQRVRGRQDVGGQTVLRLVERRGAHIRLREATDRLGERDMDAVGVDPADALVAPLMDELVPDRDPDPTHAAPRAHAGSWRRSAPPESLPRIGRQDARAGRYRAQGEPAARRRSAWRSGSG
jgi:hypothetical protein